MKRVLKDLFEYKTLPKSKAKEVLLDIGKGVYNEHEIASFITVYLMRSVTIDELQGFSEALMELCLMVELEDPETVDIVGTGGDGKNTFNISTLACFVVAGAGQKVAKHGNYGASTISGSSNVMESMGYHFSNKISKLQHEVEATGITFLHAPLFHPALKIVAPVRKNLGVRTFFNMLGPMVNPAQPSYQIVGVYSPEMGRIYNYLLQQKAKTYTIIHSLDGYDEISLTNDTKVITRDGEKIMTPEQLGKRLVQESDLRGGDSVEDAARIFKRIIKGEGTWAQNAVVIANAAIALNATGKYSSYEDAYLAAVESLESGRAYQSLKSLMEMQ